VFASGPIAGATTIDEATTTVVASRSRGRGHRAISMPSIDERVARPVLKGQP
jgi:hypothetical protein